MPKGEGPALEPETGMGMLQEGGSDYRTNHSARRDLRKMNSAVTFCALLAFILAILMAYLLVDNFRSQQDMCATGQFLRARESDRLRQRASVRQKSMTPMKDSWPALQWEHKLGSAFIKNQMNYTNNFLVIPESGDYFVYSQVTFRGSTPECGKINQKNRSTKPNYVTQIITRVTDRYPEPTQLLTGTKSICEIGSTWFIPIYLGAVFPMQEGDKLMVNVSDISLVDYTKEDKTFFGAFLL
ncbi:tumor necrosis factor ligand superfamily member 15 isoform X2 [Phascolarctos cinereus]|uniref:Tumor necrosis factor ligand superfamily member 15 n=1 Tax=Phascolarctos cinereus TaxID=38626 RepID=A0A6P5KKX7_PHACI|nr:tumor necrosis factor ligand superfamily member 15 isoform X2 [Phascolarctos cinereus]